MPTATFRFHGALNDFLAPARRDSTIEYVFEGEPAVKDSIEALGVPHPEVDLILACGNPVGFDHRLEAGDEVDVFGLDRTPDPERSWGLIPPPPQPRRFVLDGHLGRLARYLRMLGFDSAYDRNAVDEELARVSAGEERILLTRDRGLLRRSIVRLGYLVRSDEPRRQLAEVVDRYGLAEDAAPFSRCVRCNGSIEPVAKAEIAARLADEPRTLRHFDLFGRCASCGAIYWQGSHFDRMSRLVEEVVRQAGPSGRIGSRSSAEDGE